MNLQPATRVGLPATWTPWVFGPERIPGAAVTCPNGHGMSVGGGGTFGSVHRIDAGGQVSPSLVCHSCGWHVFVRLDGWP